MKQQNASTIVACFLAAIGLQLIGTSPALAQDSWQEALTLYTPVYHSDTSYTWAHVAFGNGIFVVTTDTAIYSSSDGIHWVRRLSQGANGLAFGNGRFVATGGIFPAVSMLVSTDGINWQSASATGAPLKIDFRYGKFIGSIMPIGDQTKGDFLISQDGVQWLRQNSSEMAYRSEYANGLYYYGADSFEADNKYFTSPNWVAWTEHPWNMGENYSIKSVFYLNHRYVYVGTYRYYHTSSHAYRYEAYFVSSADGVTFTPGNGVAAYSDEDGEINKVVQVNGVLVLVGGKANYGYIFTSEDGLTFTQRPCGDFGTRLHDMAYGNGTFVAVGDKILTSFQPPTLTPTSRNHDGGAGSGSFSVTAAGASSWSAVAGPGWIHTSSSGSGNGTVTYTVDANGGANSRSGSITVGGQAYSVTQLPAVAPAIAAQPQSLFAVVGGKAGFRVVANGTSPLSYQWRKDGINLPAQTATNLMLTNVQWAQAGHYTVVVTNVAGAVTSAPPALLTVVEGVALDFVLSPTYVLVSVPFSETTLTNAAALAQAIPSCLGVWRWDAGGQGWYGHRPGGPNNFTIAGGEAFMVSVGDGGQFTVLGAWAAAPQSLRTGFNLVYLPKAHEALLTAEAMATNIPNCAGVWEWRASAQGWNGHRTGGPNNFGVEVGRPYLINVAAPGTW